MIAVSEFTKRELVDAARRRPPAKIRVVPNAVEDVFTPDGPRAEGDYVLAVGTLEPRKNLARIAQAVDGELRVVGARGWGGVEPPANVTWLGDVDRRGARRALPRRALPRLRVALRGLRHPGRRGARLRLPGRDERAARRWRSSPATTRRYVDPTDVESIRDGIARAQRPDAAPRRRAWARGRGATRAVYEELA